MKGKVFATSQDLYQDQAKILFDFYKEAAEKIVSQEEAVEQEKANIESVLSDSSSKLNGIKVRMIVGAVVAVIGIVLIFVLEPLYGIIVLAAGGFFAFKSYKSFKENQNIVLNGDQKLAELDKKYKDIFRDYKIDKMGVAYVPVASQIPFENKSFLIDHTGKFAQQEFELQLVNNQKRLTEKMKELDELSTSAPLVEGDKEMEEVDTNDYSRSIQQVKFYDYFGRLDRNLRTSAHCLSDVSTSSVSMPVIPPDSSVVEYLNEFGTTQTEGATIVNVFDTHAHDEELEQFNQLNQMRRDLSNQNMQFEDVLRRLIANVGYAVQTIATLKVASSNKLVDRSNQLLFSILKTSYNHYSPVLEKDELNKMRQTNFNFRDTVENYTPFNLKESSRVRYDLNSDSWVAEDGSRTTMPYGISQIQEEIVAPIVQNLLTETRINRLEIYNDIDNQKRDYLNQWHRETQDFYGRNRASSDDLINLMRANLTQFLAAQTTFERLERMKGRILKQMSDEETREIGEDGDGTLTKNLAHFSAQSQSFKETQENFKEYMKLLQTDINDRAEEYGFVEYFDATLRDRVAKDIVEAGDNISQLDDRRRPLVAINPLYAFTSALPPTPAREDIVDEQMSMNVATVAANSLQELDEKEGTMSLAGFRSIFTDSEDPSTPEAPSTLPEEELRMAPSEEEIVSEPVSEEPTPEEPAPDETILSSPAEEVEEAPGAPADDLEPDDLDDSDDLDDLDDLDGLDDPDEEENKK